MTPQQFMNAAAAGIAKQGHLGDKGRAHSPDGALCAVACAAKELSRPYHEGVALARKADPTGVLLEQLTYDHDSARNLPDFWKRLRRACRWLKLEIPTEARA